MNCEPRHVVRILLACRGREQSNFKDGTVWSLALLYLLVTSEEVTKYQLFSGSSSARGPAVVAGGWLLHLGGVAGTAMAGLCLKHDFMAMVETGQVLKYKN